MTDQSAQTPAADPETRVKTAIQADDVVLFMKGIPDIPQCGFSSTVVKILDHLGVSYAAVNVLEDDGIRSAVKTYSDWPTVPQLYVKGAFVGGCDIVRDMFESGEMRAFLTDKGVAVANPG